MTAQVGESSVTELGINVLQNSTGTETKKHKAYNPRMKILREAVLCILKQHIIEKKTERINCVDAIGGSGLTGLQWKKHFGQLVDVTIADIDNTDEIQLNCIRSGLSYKYLDLKLDQVPGDQQLQQSVNEVHIAKCAPKVLLHLEAYDFIYLNPDGNLALYLDAVFSNLRNHGILCLVTTDISHQFVRTSQAVRRYFSANVIKTDYMRELAVRVVLSAIARSAAKCNKGIECLLSLCIDDFFLIVTRVVRGPKHADSCHNKVCPLIHCQMCDERAFYPNCMSPVEEPYKLLPCDCKLSTPGKTAVVLGPVWSDNIFHINFVSGLMKHSRELNLHEKIQIVFTTIKEESLCTSECDVDMSQNASNEFQNGEPVKKRQKCQKHVKEIEDEIKKHMPPFFYDIHRRKLKGVNLPKTTKLLFLLRSEGYRASRTHFDPNAVRTNATLKQLYSILLKFCSVK